MRRRSPWRGMWVGYVLVAWGCAADDWNATRHKVERQFPQVLRRPEPLPAGTYFVFAYFRDPGSELFLALSTDGYEWTPVHGDRPVLRSSIWLRDPSVARGPDGTFHMVFTGGGDDAIGYAWSRDLVTWSRPRAVRVMGSMPGTKACWAPELVWDPQAGHWVIAWSSEIEGRFTETKDLAKANHRLYACTTPDFQTFTEPRLLLDPGYPVIDPSYLYAEGRWWLFFKDERDRPAKKQLRVVSGPTPLGPWSPPSEALTVKRVEGACAVQVGEDYMVYFDEYRWGRYGAIRSRDLRYWEDVSGLVKFPPGARHGAVLHVPTEIGRRLAETQPEPR